MLRFLLISSLAGFLAVSILHSSSKPGKPREQPQQKVLPNTLSAKDLEGTFTGRTCFTYSYAETHPGLAPDASHWTTCERANILVKGDSMWFFEYPCLFNRVVFFEIKNGDSIYFDHEPKASARVTIEDRYVVFSSHDDHRSQSWYRDTFDLLVLQQLKKDTFNFSCLTGKLRLMTEYYGAEDGSYFDCRFPVNLPGYADMGTAGNAGQLYASKKMYLRVNGVLRDFEIKEIKWNENADPRDSYKTYVPDWKKDEYPCIFLAPGSWWKGLCFTLEYRVVQPGDEPQKKLVKAAYPVWIDVAFREVKHPQMEKLGRKLEAAGYISDPVILRQHYTERSEQYQQYWGLTPVQSAGVVYYTMPLDSHEVIKYGRKNNRTDVVGGADFKPLFNAKSISGYYFRQKMAIDKNITDIDLIDDGMVEIWEFVSNADALKASAFLDDYLAKDLWQPYVPIIDSDQKASYRVYGKYLYCVYTMDWWTNEQDYKNLVKKILE